MRVPTAASAPSPVPRAPDPASVLFAGLFGLLLGVALLKCGHPVILDRLVEMPKNADEWRGFAWPVRVLQIALVPVILAGFLAGRSGRSPQTRAPAAVLAGVTVWLGWQVLATFSSIDPTASQGVVLHFACCAACFGLGHWALSRVEEPRVFWLCVGLAFAAVLVIAFQQHFGGLEETRRFIFENPGSAKLPAEYVARIMSNRVFSTLVYPNALAGALLLLLPAFSVLAFRYGARWGHRPARVVGGLALLAGLAVLVWSGSKAGWLIAMAIALFVLVHSPLSRRTQALVAVGFVVAGLAGFLVTFRAKLAQGPTSVVARRDYWAAAWQGFQERPILGQGPGAFRRIYARVKRPESEMAQLAHNDYLQQATDSGLPGFIAYAGFIGGALASLYRRRAELRRDPLLVAVGLGVLAWYLQGLVEFGLYLPATSWCAFALLGWLLTQKPSPASP